MIREETITETKTVKTITCDFCGNESLYTYSPIKPCQVCERDVCPSCAIELDYPYCDLEHPSFGGDHSDYVCKSCWGKGEGIRKEIMQIRKSEEEQEERLIKEWENLSKEGNENL